jgi:hypothetical protein
VTSTGSGPGSTIERARSLGAQCFLETFGGENPWDSRLTESDIAQRWLGHMKRCSDLLPGGWYQPPPGGLAVLIGEAPKFKRLEYESLRDESSWPRNDIPLLPGSLVYAYASPVDRETGLIGDLGFTLYSGPDERLQEYLRTCLRVTLDVARYAEPGMALCDLYTYADSRITGAGFRNQTPSSTDPGAMNVGHTVPWSYPSGAPDVDLSDMVSLRDQIRTSRLFLNSRNTTPIGRDMTFTVEPRFISDNYPMCGYHVIVSFTDGVRDISTCFREIFEQFGMLPYMEDVLTAPSS